MTELSSDRTDARTASLLSPRMRLILAAIAAVAIIVGLFMSRSRSTGEPPLPDFTLQSLGGPTSSRAGDTRAARPLQVDTNVRVELPLVPASPVVGSIEFRVVLERPNGDVVVPVEVVKMDHDGYRLTVAGPEIKGTPLGDASLVVFAAHAGLLSNDAAALKAMASNGDVRVLRQPLTVVAPRR